MRFALDAGSDTGKRAARILLGDKRCDSLVMVNADWMPQDPRVTHSTDLEDVDIVVTDGATSLNNLVARCSVAGIPLVTSQDVADAQMGTATVPIVVGANVHSTLAASLLTHPAALPTAAESSTIAWTEAGPPLKSGTAIAFPEPVGNTWARPSGDGTLVGLRADEWMGAAAVIEGTSGRRSVGVADIGAHLEAIALVAVSLAVMRGVFGPGTQSSEVGRAVVLEEARSLELDIAVWRSVIS